MNLPFDEFFAQHPGVRVAAAEDNAELLRFFRRSEMKTDGISMRFERGPDFFRYLNNHSDKNYVAIFKNDDGSIGGVASLCLRKNYLNGEEVNAAYLGDLRLSPHLSRATRLSWRMFYADFLARARQIPEFNHCRHFYSVVLDENKQGISALIRKNGPIVYRPLAHYQTVSLITRWPRLFGKRAKKSFCTIRKANAGDLGALQEFLTRQHRDKVFGQHEEEWSRRLNSWDCFDISSFWLAVDVGGTIRACVCPWEGASTSRQLIVSRMPWHLRLLGRLLPLVGKRKLTMESELKILYLTPLEFDASLARKARADVLHDFLNAIYDSGVTKNFHLVSFFDYTHQSLLRAVRGQGFLYQLTPATLYQVLHRDFESEEGLIEVQGDKLPGLDIGNA